MAFEEMTLEDVEKYRKVFKAPPPLDNLGCFDVFKFDDILHKRHGYAEEEHGSIVDFLTTKYGEGFQKFVSSLIGKQFKARVGS